MAAMKLSRKTFFKGLAIGALSMPVVLRSCMGDSHAQEDDQMSQKRGSGQRYNWKMTTTWPPNFPIIGEACQLFADQVERLSDGRMRIKVYGGGELAPALEAFDVVRSGAVEMGSGAAYYWAGKSNAAPFFASVPFGMNAQQLMAWITVGGGQALWEELYAPFNLVPMLSGNTGVQMGGWFNRPIDRIADLQGLKMRIPGLGGKVLEKAGGAPVLLAGGEIYTGLERGIIDATEWLGPFHDTLMGFHEIARYYYSPGWQEPGTALELIVNKEKYDSLPPDLQQIIRAAAAQTHIWCWSKMEAANAKALGELKGKGVEIRKFPEEVLDQLRKYTNEVINEMVEKDPFTRKVYESYDQFRRQMADYGVITEKVFYDYIQ